jgi:DegV family protein with EDD domain
MVMPMNNCVIVADSCCDLPSKLADELGVVIIPLSFMLKGIEYHNYLDERQISSSDFYNLVRSGEQSTTSAINSETYKAIFSPLLSSGSDIIYICLSSGLSASYQFSALAAAELAEEFPDRNICMIDSLSASMGMGLLVYLAAKKKELCASFVELRDYIEEIKHRVCHWFTVDDLNHLRRGGRISLTTAAIGIMLNIKPVLHVDIDGHLVSVSKARGRKKSLEELVERMAATAVEPESQTVFVSHGDCLPDAEYVAELVRSRFGVKDIVISSIGPVIGSHSGPGTAALFFLGAPR